MFSSFEKFLEQFGPQPGTNLYPRFMYRKGGALLDWTDPGNINFTPTNAIIQAGCIEWDGLPSADDDQLVTFKAHYAAKPMVFVQVIGQDPLHAVVTAWVEIETSQFTIHWHSVVAVTEIFFVWLAIGGQLATSP